MNIRYILTNNQFRNIFIQYENINSRIKKNDSSLLGEPDIVRLKDQVVINRSSEASLLLMLFPILISISYIMLVIVFYGFYFSSDIAGFQRSAGIFIISIICLLTLYAYRGSLFALKTLNVLNTVSIIFAIAILLFDYFVYYMHHEWYLLTIVFFNFLSNRIIINSKVFSQTMTEILWFRTTNHILRKKIDGIAGRYDVENHEKKIKIKFFKKIWQYCVLNRNLNNVLKISYNLNQRVENNDISLLTEDRLNKYRNLLNFGVQKKALLITLLSTVLLVTDYVMTTFILLSHLDNKNDLPILFFVVALALMFSSFSILLTHRGVNFGFKILIIAHYLFIVLFIILVVLKFVVGILDYSNISLCFIAVSFLLTFFMLNTQYYCNYLKELHCFLAWHKMIRKNSKSNRIF
ncbi:hypothetical protein Xvie_02685 [Xenorhabdus vietnamensis]|uniref:Uncharacterized protein n=1 Tax=Xenorhabdus vietnamensis TaxID=351656 RepID=A0A1Y2SCD4_9GAMM|nr:hypothetical protein [Xenorhabdus vietnamensis]OTA15603.1 hypothetical protein Xvie_02685 [Xenorhabdus vietnamensis]